MTTALTQSSPSASRSPLLVFLLLVPLLSLSVPSALTFDACEYLSYKVGKFVGPARLSEYRACLQSIPFHKAEASSVINTLWKVLGGIYPYANVIKNLTNATPYSIKVDIRGRLLAISKKAYKSDYDFQMDLIELVTSLNDGHTEWRPYAFSSAYGTSIQPFPMYMVSDAQTNSSQLLVAPLDAIIAAEDSNPIVELIYRVIEAGLGINIIDYAGAKVVKINGVDAVTYAGQFAKTTGVYRDPQARLNSLFLRPSPFTDEIILGDLMAPANLPANDSITFTFIKNGTTKEETLVVPYYIVFNGYSFTNASTFYENNCVASTNATAITESASLGLKDHNPVRGFKLRPRMNATMRGRASTTTSSSPTLLTSPDASAKAYLLADKITGVIVLPDFLGTYEYQGYYYTASNPFLDLFIALEFIKNSTAKRLLISLSDNGGGDVIAATVLRELLFPNSSNNQYLLQFKAPPIVQHVAKVVQKDSRYFSNYSSYTRFGFIHPNTNKPFTKGADFFFPLVNLTQSGATDTFSSYFKFAINDTYLVDDYATYPYNDYELPTTRYFKPKDVLIISNGLCFSTCSIFVSEMKDLGVRVVSTGGLPSSGSFSPSSGSAGFVQLSYLDYYLNNIYFQGLQRAAYTLDLLPVTGSLSFTLAQAVRPSSQNIPLEFEYRKAEYSLPYSEDNVLDSYKVWKDASAFF